ncbi:MAG TPA: heavy-metal-associated domain-containing protein [Chloroflexi bacterium]|nr:heavy-metal-associated domain-containing protein [Chloroflexota bacterium]
MTTKTYSVPDISCGHCTATIERELQLIEGLESVKAELDSKRVTVEVQREDVLAEVEKMLEEIGYPAAVG